MSDRVETYEYTTAEFQAILDKAEANARTDRESVFVDSMLTRWAEYGLQMFLSEAQLSWLKKIAER